MAARYSLLHHGQEAQCVPRDVHDMAVLVRAREEFGQIPDQRRLFDLHPACFVLDIGSYTFALGFLLAFLIVNGPK